VNRHIRIKIISTLLILFASTQVGSQQSRARVWPCTRDGFLCVSAQINDLFSSKTVATIQSGLPAIVDFEIRLQTSGQRVVAKRRISRRITHDVWKGTYKVTGGAINRIFTSLDSAQAACGNLPQLVILSLTELDDQTAYTLLVQAQITPISQVQNQKLKDWLANPNQTVEDIPGRDRSSGFNFNFSKLISFFVGSKELKENSTPWFQSQAFFVNDLE